MQRFVKCPFCDRVYDANAERSVRVTIDRQERTAHLACVMKASPGSEAKPNGDAKGNGPLQAEAVV